jgi:hypothetical protein
MAEMYIDGAGMRAPGGGGPGRGYGGGGGYGGGYGYSNGGRGPGDPAVAGGAPGNGFEAATTNVLRLRGLPFSAQKEDIVRWFEDVQVTPLPVERCAHSCLPAFLPACLCTSPVHHAAPAPSCSGTLLACAQHT